MHGRGNDVELRTVMGSRSSSHVRRIQPLTHVNHEGPFPSPAEGLAISAQVDGGPRIRTLNLRIRNSVGPIRYHPGTSFHLRLRPGW
jgi:hypothetical protein